MVLPAAVRERFHWSPGATLHLQADETGVRLQDRAAILAEIRALGAPLRAQGYTLERLVAELAEEAEEE